MKNFKYSLLVMVFSILSFSTTIEASSHREAPLIANDPLADNTDLYAFRSPDDPNTVTIIANYIPGQLPHGGPNYYSFGENIRYQIHIDNDINTMGDDIIYRFTFAKENEDPTTFFNIRLGAENLKTTYLVERSTDGGQSFETVLENGTVPPNNIGTRSIQSNVGLGAYSYERIMQAAIATTNTGETVFCGPIEDPFYVDLGGVFDLGDLPRQNDTPRDGLECYNVHTICLKVPITTLQKDGKGPEMASNILDGDYTIGVWASASRPAIRTLMPETADMAYSGDWVQVSRLGMPLTNEAVIPIGSKDEWNARTPYNENPDHFAYFFNPELALYMDDDQFGSAVPAFSPLRIQKKSLAGLFGADFPGFDFSNGADGLYGLKGSDAVAGTALDDAVFGSLLLPGPGMPRSVDLWPAFHTGVPNVPPYQLATGKMGNPLNMGKPFVNNFLPNGGDMLRLNMAVPPTPRNSSQFSALGLIQAAVLGLTDPTYASNTNIEFIPNMDGFPNGRRLEDDVTRIELQAVSGAVLAAVGLWYDDYDPNDALASPVTPNLLNVISYSTGVDKNDQAFQKGFPYVAAPYSATGPCSGQIYKAAPPAEPICAISVWHEIICNEDKTTYNVMLNISNGVPPYVITGDVNEIVQTADAVVAAGPFSDGSTYNFMVVDAAGCSVTITESPIPCSKLPISLVSFTGEVLEDGNALAWISASEVDHSHYILQRSADGTSFRNITKIAAKGSPTSAANYSFLDKQAPQGLSYYRLLDIDLNERQNVSGVLSLVRGETNNSFGISHIHPLPANEFIQISYNAGIENGSTINIRLFDANSKEVFRKELSNKNGTQQELISLEGLNAGVYFLSLQKGQEIITNRIIKF